MRLVYQTSKYILRITANGCRLQNVDQTFSRINTALRFDEPDCLRSTIELWRFNCPSNLLHLRQLSITFCAMDCH
jgi:hypothetical protein